MSWEKHFLFSNPVVFYGINTARLTVHDSVTCHYPVVVGNIHLAPEELC